MHSVLEYLAVDNWLRVGVENSFCVLGPNWKMIKLPERFLPFTLVCSAGVKHLQSIHVHIWPCVFFEPKVFIAVYFFGGLYSGGLKLRYIFFSFWIFSRAGMEKASWLNLLPSALFHECLWVAIAKLPWPEETVMPTQWVGSDLLKIVSTWIWLMCNIL